MITLYQGPRAWGAPNMSPFCTKLETYLRMAKVPYEIAPFNPTQAPKGKMPYIKEGDQLMGDSGLIIDHLKARDGDPVDGHLTPAQRAQGHALAGMLESNTYFTSVYTRWCIDENYVIVRDMIFGELPALVRLLVAPVVRRKVRQGLRAQGMARHSEAEIYAIGRRDIKCAATLLGEGPYLFGERPSSYDAVLFAFMVGLSMVPFDSPLKEAVLSHESLVNHRDRMARAYFSDVMKAEG